MSNSIVSSIAAAIGTDHVRTNGGGRVVATPPSVEALAHTLGLAYDNGWSTVVTGAGSWQVNDTPAVINISTRALDQLIKDVRPAWRITVQAGASLDAIQRSIGAQGAALHFDPPGRPDRSIGSVVATGSLGPLQFPLASQIVGHTVVTGDGRIIRTVCGTLGPEAAEDQLRPHIGGFGAFGVISEVTVRVRESNQVDQTFVAVGDRDRLTAATRSFDERLCLSGNEIFSPALAAQPDWLLALRHLHNGDAWHGSMREEGMAMSPGLIWRELPPAEAAQLWASTARAMIAGPVTLRLAATRGGFDEILDLVIERLGEGVVSANPNHGTLRWCGAADVETLRGLRSALAAREIPLTLERAPWPIRRAVGHLGAYHEGLGGELSRLRQEFDPGGILAPALVMAEGESR